MSRFTRFARHKFSAARHLKLFCTPDHHNHCHSHTIIIIVIVNIIDHRFLTIVIIILIVIIITITLTGLSISSRDIPIAVEVFGPLMVGVPMNILLIRARAA